MTRFTLDALNPRMREQAAQKLGLMYGEATCTQNASPKTQKANKYGAVKVDAAEGKFDSKREYRHWQELKLREAAGEISGLRRQVRFSLFDPGENCRGEHWFIFRADFVFKRNGCLVVADSKSAYTRKLRGWERIKSAMLACHGIEVTEL